ncbi:MAG: tRNA dihydrouridine synthase DusB [Clostridia bacterium]|nr:tRNA dihydrouridine synthase DusB [Clostridia bacterium]
MTSAVHLAPMAGVTDSPFRQICKGFGADFVTTEMVSAKGLYYKSKKTAYLMSIAKEELPTAIQFFGSDPDIMAEVAPLLQQAGASAIDINMGCPMPKIVTNGDGSALMKNPHLAGKIVKAVKNAVNIPVTVKIRKGWDSDTCSEFAKVLEANGADGITVHARTKEQLYSGKADLNAIKKVKNAVKISVIGNGDIFSAEDAKNMLDFTGCDGVMVGRGALGNPFIFRQIKELLENGTTSYSPSDSEKLQTALLHTKMLCENHGEHIGVLESRKHIAWYVKGMHNANTLKNRVFTAKTLAEIVEILESAMLFWE